MHQMQVRGTESGRGAVTEVDMLQGQRSGTSMRQGAKTLSVGEGTETHSVTKRNQRRKTEVTASQGHIRCLWHDLTVHQQIEI